MQHGHTVDRKDIETFVEKAPKAWSKAFNTIIVYTAVRELFQITYHLKEKVLGIHISKKYEGTTSEAIEEIAVASQAIEALGHIPDKLPKQKESDYRMRWAEIRG
jgi:hypothetical protein